MLREYSFWHRGNRYLAVRSPQRVPESGRRLSRLEAHSLLSRVLREDPSAVRRLYADLSREPVVANVSNDGVLRWLGRQLADACGAGGCLIFVQVSDWASSIGGPTEAPEMRRLKAAIARLGTGDLVHQGHRYRVVAALGAERFSRRAEYETLSESEGVTVLAQMASESGRSATEREAIEQLLELEKRQQRALALLVLRRLRSMVERAEAGPMVTPSQLRAARERDWVAVEVVDRDELPVAGVRLELILPDGAVTALSTDPSGLARLGSVAPGRVTIRVLELDGESWRPVGGAASAASSQRPARTHVMREGECLSKVGARYGFKGWQTLWEHPQNEGLRNRRSTPHVLAPGDVVAIPRLAVHEIVRDTGAVHRIEVARGSALVRLRLQDLAGNPLAGLTYHYGFRTEERDVRKPGSNATDADGWLEEMVPCSVTQLAVDVRLPKLRFVYDLRRLHPARDRDTDTPNHTGIAQRLVGLGYRRRAQASESLCPAGVTLFQALQLQRDDATGEPDRQTLDALEGAYTV